MVAKRKIAFQSEKGYTTMETANPPKTVRRNTRERNRVKQIDQGFEKLRVTIPSAAAQKKISRVKILASAVDYIQHLHTMLAQVEGVKQEISPLPTPPKSSTPQTMSSYGHPHFPHPGYMTPGWNHYTSPHSPISPGYHLPWPHSQPQPPSDPSLTSPVPSSYYSAPQQSPRLPLTPQATPTSQNRSSQRCLTRDSLSPGSSTYSDSSLHSPYLPPATLPLAQVTQDPTPSSTFREEDELLDSIVQWEKY